MEKTFSAQVDYERVRSLYHRALSEYGNTATGTSSTPFHSLFLFLSLPPPPLLLSPLSLLYHPQPLDSTKIETWLDLVKLEADRKDFKAMQTIYWQAKNRLTDPSVFIEKYNLIK